MRVPGISLDARAINVVGKPATCNLLVTVKRTEVKLKYKSLNIWHRTKGKHTPHTIDYTCSHLIAKKDRVDINCE